MPRKNTIVFTRLFSFLVFVLLGTFMTVSPNSVQAGEKTFCEAKPLMQKEITASFPQSSYKDCLFDKSLCENMQATEPQSEKKELLASTKKASESSKPPGAKPSPSPTVKPSPKPELSAASAATPIPTLPPQNTGGVLSADRLFDMINAHRAGKGLPAYQKEDRLCQLATSRGPELDNEIFGSGYIHQGMRERNLPFWITENMISKGTEEAAMAWWLNSSIHRAGIESSKQYACGVCQGRSCAMLFTSWEPK